MKLFLKFICILIGVFVLTELNSNSLITDVKNFFKKGPDGFSFNVYSSSYTDTIPNDYLQILHLKDSSEYAKTSQLYLEHTVVNSLKGHSSAFVFQRKYYLTISTLSTSFNSSLNSSVKHCNISPKQFSGYLESDDNTPVEYSYKISPPQNITKVYLKLLGKNNKVMVSNDSVFCYYSLFRAFSIQYNNQDAPAEIFAETKGSNLFYTSLLPIEILFIKRNHNLYLLTMSAFIDDGNMKYTPGMLYNLIKSNYANNH